MIEPSVLVRALCESLATPIKELPILEPTAGFWERAGRSRAKLLSRNVRARLTDTLIALAL